jgi:hypothetical protein
VFPKVSMPNGRSDWVLLDLESGLFWALDNIYLARSVVTGQLLVRNSEI